MENAPGTRIVLFISKTIWHPRSAGRRKNQTKAFEKRYLKSALRATNYFIEGREDRQKKDKTGKRKDKGQKTKKQAGFSQNKQQKEKANTEEKRKQSTVHCETKEEKQV